MKAGFSFYFIIFASGAFMLKKIMSSIIGFDEARPSLTEKYLSDYAENESFISGFSDQERDYLFSNHVHDRIAINELDRSLVDEAIFSSVKYINIIFWLRSTGYGKKLVQMMDRLSYKDDYGDIVFDDAAIEIKKFVSRRVIDIQEEVDGVVDDFYVSEARRRRKLDWLLVGENDDFAFSAADAVLSVIDFFRCGEESAANDLEAPIDPYEYERWVSSLLERAGWDSRPTKGSGDQGADVIAQKNGFVIVIQCKRYEQPVGNKAVQEVASAERFYGGNASIVVSNNTFTKSARQLAESLGVHLAHHDNLVDLVDLLISGNPPDDCQVAVWKEDVVRFESEKDILSVIDNVAATLESLGWETSHDPDDVVDENGEVFSSVFASKYDMNFFIECTALKSFPVGKDVLEFSWLVFSRMTEKSDFLVVTTSTGFTDDAIEYGNANGIIMIDNDHISSLDVIVEDA